MTDLAAFAAALPKAELHLHIEGSLEPELMFALATRNKVEIPFNSVEEVRAAYSFSNLQDFLDIYYRGADVLRTAEDFHDLAFAYLERAHADNVRHAEIMFDPQTHTDRGIPFAVVMEGLLSALAEGERRFGITSRLILSMLRHLDEEAAFATLREADPWLEHITAIGLDSSELGHPPEKFARVYAAAAERGLRRTAHAGEEGPAAYVIEALDRLGAERIDHGNNALDDAALTMRLARAGTTLTVCPLSNLKLCVVDDMGRHPLPDMLRSGLRATVNSDDPAYFGGYLNDNFRALAATGRFTAQDFVTLARNSFLGSFLPDAVVARHLATLPPAS